MQPSRRAFLLGRQRPSTPWEAFVQRLGRGVAGRVQGLEGSGPPQARLLPVHRDDVRYARTLCAEYGVALRLGTTRHRESYEGCVLEVDPTPLTGLSNSAENGQWLAQPGCLLGELAAVGLLQFQHAPPEWTLAAWMASPQQWAPGETADSGVIGVEVLLSDGTIEMLGPFGESDLRPLQSATVQRLVPALFQLSSSVDARVCRTAAYWHCCYRLDALQPMPPFEVNLGQLLLGHGGGLAWVESVVLVPGRLQLEPPRLEVPPESEVMNAAYRLQRRIKDVFDPTNLYIA